MPRKAKERSSYVYKINPVQQFRAETAPGPEFSWSCDIHGETKFLALENCCSECWAANAALPPRARAAAAKAEFYADLCPDHGMVKFRVSRGECSECFDGRGRNRAEIAAQRLQLAELKAEHRRRMADAAMKRVGPRAAARRAGLSEYIDTCPKHGPMTIFHVNSGKCLQCFSANGLRRVYRLLND